MHFPKRTVVDKVEISPGFEDAVTSDYVEMAKPLQYGDKLP